MRTHATIRHPFPIRVADVARQGAVWGLATFSVLVCGCFPPPPSAEREASARKIAEAFFAAMQTGDVTQARQHTTYTKDEQLAEFVPVFQDGNAEPGVARIAGTTNRLYLDYVIRYPDGSGQRIRLMFHERGTDTQGGWSGDRIENLEVMGKEPAR